eukprot:7364075-Lingulodinium_polyedra.AAC.1
MDAVAEVVANLDRGTGPDDRLLASASRPWQRAIELLQYFNRDEFEEMNKETGKMETKVVVGKAAL